MAGAFGLAVTWLLFGKIWVKAVDSRCFPRFSLTEVLRNFTANVGFLNGRKDLEA